jgi:hypothetical protein
MRVHRSLFAVALLTVAGCAAEASENDEASSAALSREEWNLPPRPDQQLPVSFEQQPTTVVTHAAPRVPVTPSAPFGFVVGRGPNTKP